MKASGKAYIHLELKDFEYPNEVYEQIRAEIGEKSPARMLSEYIYRLLLETKFAGSVAQVNAIPEQWTE